MHIRYAAAGLAVLFALPSFAQKKEDERLANSADVLREILSEDNGLPRSHSRPGCLCAHLSERQESGFGFRGKLWSWRTRVPKGIRHER